MKKYSVLVLAMSTLPNPLKKKDGTESTAFDDRYVYYGRGSKKNIYHGIGQLESVPQYIFDKFGALTHFIILQTNEVKEPLKGIDWEKVNEEINSENGDHAPIKYSSKEEISAVKFFQKRIEAFYRKKEKEENKGKFKKMPRFIPVNYSENQPLKGLEKILKKLQNLYSDCVEENGKEKIDKCWNLFIDVHGGFRTTSMAMFALIQTLSAPDLKSGRVQNLDAALARLTDGKGTIPISHVYTVNYDPNNPDPKNNPHKIVEKTKFYQLFTKESLEAYMNYGQYAQMALKSSFEIDETNNVPYAFISYRHTDAPKERFAFLGMLKKEGYRYWYDDLIGFGEEWEAKLRKANTLSAVFIALITENYYESSQCLKELDQAIRENKKIFYVSLDGSPLYSQEQDIVKDDIIISKEALQTNRQMLSLSTLIVNGVYQQYRLRDKLEEGEYRDIFLSLKSNKPG